jgi:drug/metabolite transporter (DMT)-like permease
MEDKQKGKRATVFGFTAILLWGMLALLTSMSGDIPPFQLTAMTFFIAFLVGAAAFLKSSRDFSIFRQPPAVWFNGIFGLFGYHAIYFMAMKSAPSIEASLIAYLWPILIVLFSSFLPGERLRWFHLLGVALGFAGVAVLLLRGGFAVKQEYMLGYVLAFLCAIIWAVYSVVSRKFCSAPTMLIGAFCGITAIMSFVCHLLFEKTVMVSGVHWIPVVLLGLGPVGIAFFAWDRGMKRGNIKLLGTLSYAAPLLSSVLLMLFGRAAFSWGLFAGCGLIVAGSLMTAIDRLRGMFAKKQVPNMDS